MNNPLVLLETTSGDILLELFPETTPKTVENFLQYVDEGFYDNTVFHRVIPGFMIQGGGLTLRMEEKETRAPIENEGQGAKTNATGTIAMARTGDPHSATAQFFINTVDNADLDFSAPVPEGFGYCVFGQVIDGMDVVKKIEKNKTRPQGDHEAVPVDSVLITKASRFE